MERQRIQFLRELCKLQTLKNLLIFHENLFIFLRKNFIASTLCLKLKKTAEFKFNIHQNAIDNRVLFISI